jgi:hypothetical protein
MAFGFTGYMWRRRERYDGMRASTMRDSMRGIDDIQQRGEITLAMIP